MTFLLRHRSVRPREAAAVVRRAIIDAGTGGDDAVGADRAGLAEHTALHAGDVADLGYTGRLVEVAQVVRQVRVLAETAQVALVADVVAGIETHQAREQPPIGFGLDVAADIALRGKPLLEAIERLEQKLDRTVVSLL